MTTKTRLLDRAAMTLSTICIIHCLMLPLIVGGLPLLSVLYHNHLVHQIFVLLAIPISAYVFLKHQCNPTGLLPLRILVSAGLIFLAMGAFVEALHDYETVLTVVGATLVGTAHFLHSRRHAHA